MFDDAWWRAMVELALLLGALAAAAYLETALRLARLPEAAHRWGDDSPQYERFAAAVRASLPAQQALALLRGLLYGGFFWKAVYLGIVFAPKIPDLVWDGTPIGLLRTATGYSQQEVHISLGLAVAAAVLVGEAAPRALASRDPEAGVLWGARLLRLLRPLAWPTEALIRWAQPRPRPGEPENGPTAEEEIRLLVETSADAGILEEGERAMIHSIFRISDTPARQVMVPRTDMSCVSADASLSEAVHLVLESGHSRLPVYEGDVDHIVGVVHAKDMLEHLVGADQNPPLRALLRPPVFVPESKKLDEVLDEFRADGQQLAIVVDEFGGTAGLISVEDVIEEIVGEIQDEYDIGEQAPAVLEHTENGALVDARLPIDEVNEALELELPEGDYDTLGGYVFGLFGRQPREGARVAAAGWEFQVEEMDGRRLARIRIRPAPEAAAADENLPAA